MSTLKAWDKEKFAEYMSKTRKIEKIYHSPSSDNTFETPLSNDIKSDLKRLESSFEVECFHSDNITYALDSVDTMRYSNSDIQKTIPGVSELPLGVSSVSKDGCFDKSKDLFIFPQYDDKTDNENYVYLPSFNNNFYSLAADDLKLFPKSQKSSFRVSRPSVCEKEIQTSECKDFNLDEGSSNHKSNQTERIETRDLSITTDITLTSGLLKKYLSNMNKILSGDLNNAESSKGATLNNKLISKYLSRNPSDGSTIKDTSKHNRLKQETPVITKLGRMESCDPLITSGGEEHYNKRGPVDRESVVLNVSSNISSFNRGIVPIISIPNKPSGKKPQTTFIKNEACSDNDELCKISYKFDIGRSRRSGDHEDTSVSDCSDTILSTQDRFGDVLQIKGPHVSLKLKPMESPRQEFSLNQNKFFRSFYLNPYDDLIKSHLNPIDRRIKSIASKNGCSILIEGSSSTTLSNSQKPLSYPRVVYRITLSSLAEDNIDKCFNYLKEAFPNTCMRGVNRNIL